MNPPSHGGQLHAIAERFQIPASELLDFSANINPEGPPPAVLKALREAIEDPATLTAYPDLENTALKHSIATQTGLQPQHIVVANGFVPLLDATLHALNIRQCLLPVPAFNEYRKALARAQSKVIPHPLHQQELFRYNLPLIPHQAILLANPQNPTGVLHERAAMLAIVQQAASTNTLLLLDEAFIDYTPEHSLAQLVDRYPNLIVFRSVTKFHAIPGLRVAYLAAKGETAASIEASLPPWPISTLASVAVAAALADEPYAERARTLNDQRRNMLRARLASIGIPTYPAAANYVLIRLPQGIDARTLWQRLIREHRIVLRDCSNYESLAPGHLRAAVRTEPENERLIAALQAILAT